VNIANIQQLLTSVAHSVEPVSAAIPDQAVQSRFAELLHAHTSAASENALAMQGAMNQLTVGTDLLAKVAGSLTQSINKLTNMQ
jgi:type III secretion system YscI/HrpB-like protein